MSEPFQHFDPHKFQRIARFARRVGRWYFRYDLEGIDRVPDGPCLIVGNHSGLGFVEEALMIGAWEAEHGTERRAWGLIHDFFFSAPPFASYYRSIGAIPASPDNARAAFERGDVVLVFPGGDLDCCRPFYEPNAVHFGERRGYARLALETGIPVVPLATVGSHWTWTFLPGGATLARIPLLRQLFRSDRLPVPTAVVGLFAVLALTLAFGLSWWWFAAAFIVAVLPTPVHVRSRVGEPILLAAVLADQPDDDQIENGHALVHGTLQRMVTELAHGTEWQLADAKAHA